MVCGIEGCKYRFLSFSGFNSHVYRDRGHRKAMGLQTSPGPVQTVTSGGTTIRAPDRVTGEEDIIPEILLLGFRALAFQIWRIEQIYALPATIP